MVKHQSQSLSSLILVIQYKLILTLVLTLVFRQILVVGIYAILPAPKSNQKLGASWKTGKFSKDIVFNHILSH